MSGEPRYDCRNVIWCQNVIAGMFFAKMIGAEISPSPGQPKKRKEINDFL